MKYLSIVVTVFFLQWVPTCASAHNKVVVIPLAGDSPPIRLFYGSVTGAGALETGNIVSSSRTAVGRYRLETGQSIGGCAVTVTKGPQSSGSFNIYGNVTAGVSHLVTYISVTTRDSAGQLNNSDFHFTAMCPL